MVVQEWLDATYVRARRDRHIVSVAVIIAVGVNTDGRREVLGMTVGHSEAEPFWVEFLRSLARRGLRGVKLVTADAQSRADRVNVAAQARDERGEQRVASRIEQCAQNSPPFFGGYRFHRLRHSMVEAKSGHKPQFFTSICSTHQRGRLRARVPAIACTCTRDPAAKSGLRNACP